MSRCFNCDGGLWVCENHTERPWEGTSDNGCECAGAGVPCPTCNIIHLHRCVETPWNNPRSFGDAVPARAATPSGPSLLRVSGFAGIAIAAFCVLYFGGQFLRAVLS